MKPLHELKTTMQRSVQTQTCCKAVPPYNLISPYSVDSSASTYAEISFFLLKLCSLTYNSCPCWNINLRKVAPPIPRKWSREESRA
jgi:hypothetical protein